EPSAGGSLHRGEVAAPTGSATDCWFFVGGQPSGLILWAFARDCRRQSRRGRPPKDPLRLLVLWEARPRGECSWFLRELRSFSGRPLQCESLPILPSVTKRGVGPCFVPWKPPVWRRFTSPSTRQGCMPSLQSTAVA